MDELQALRRTERPGEPLHPHDANQPAEGGGGEATGAKEAGGEPGMEFNIMRSLFMEQLPSDSRVTCNNIFKMWARSVHFKASALLTLPQSDQFGLKMPTMGGSREVGGQSDRRSA